MLGQNKIDHAAGAFDEVCTDIPGEPAAKLALAIAAELSGDDAAAMKTLQINQGEFDRAVERGFEDVDGFALGNVLVALAVAGFAQWGISRRLAEYRK
jgi:hypothetical protein